MSRLRRRRVAAALARLDPGGLGAWLRGARAVEQALGLALSRGYSALVLEASRRDVQLGRRLAEALPDELARVSPGRREELLSLLGLVLDERPEALLLSARALPELLGDLGGEELRVFLRSGLALSGGGERRVAHFLRRESEAGQRALEALRPGVRLAAIRGVLSHYARAHCGQDVAIYPAGGGGARSDGQNIYLPERIDRYGGERDFLAYRVLTARAVGHLEFGTYDLELDAIPGQWVTPREGETDIERMLRSYPNRSLARDLFQLTEDARIERRVRGEYPGVARDLDALRPEALAARPALADLAPVEQLVELLLRRARGLGDGGAEVGAEVRAVADRAWRILEPATAAAADGAEVARAVAESFPLAWAMLEEAAGGPPPRPRGGGRPSRGGGEPSGPPDPARPGGAEASDAYRSLGGDALSGDIRPESLSAADRRLEARARRELQARRLEGDEASLGALRRALMRREGARGEGRGYEEMVAALERGEAPSGGLVEGDEEVDHRRGGVDARGDRPVDLDAEAGARQFVYREWDGAIGDYKPSWVRLVEHPLRPGGRAFADGVREEQAQAIRRLRRRFEALRPAAYSRARGLPDGDDLDLDRVVAARVARRAGGSPGTRLYQRHLRRRRDVAVAFLLDLSSSTNEVAGASGKRIIEVEKEALILIAEALDAIGDAFAVYGFSGYGREHVAFYVAKDFTDAYDDRSRARISRMNWKMENRDGAAIRHATSKLLSRRSRSKLLVLLSDGRPLDCGCDHYFDHYAQEDTRMALREARAAGVHPFCITVDPRGSRYLEAIYGEVGYTVIERVESLPEALPRIYRRLTR